MNKIMSEPIIATIVFLTSLALTITYPLVYITDSYIHHSMPLMLQLLTVSILIILFIGTIFNIHKLIKRRFIYNKTRTLDHILLYHIYGVIVTFILGNIYHSTKRDASSLCIRDDCTINVTVPEPSIHIEYSPFVDNIFKGILILLLISCVYQTIRHYKKQKKTK